MIWNLIAVETVTNDYKHYTITSTLMWLSVLEIYYMYTAWWVHVVIFVVDLVVTKILPTTMGVTKNMAAWPVLASKGSHCHPASSVHNILLSHAICPSLFAGVAWKLWAKSSTCIDYIVCVAPRPQIGLLSWIKINSEGPLTFHKNYLPYGTAFPWNHTLKILPHI